MVGLRLSAVSKATQISSFASGSVVLAWDASPDASVTGYRVSHGVASGDYTNSAVVGNVTTATFTNRGRRDLFFCDGIRFFRGSKVRFPMDQLQRAGRGAVCPDAERPQRCQHQ